MEGVKIPWHAIRRPNFYYSIDIFKTRFVYISAQCSTQISGLSSLINTCVCVAIFLSHLKGNDEKKT